MNSFARPLFFCCCAYLCAGFRGSASSTYFRAVLRGALFALESNAQLRAALGGPSGTLPPAVQRTEWLALVSSTHFRAGFRGARLAPATGVPMIFGPRTVTAVGNQHFSHMF